MRQPYSIELWSSFIHPEQVSLEYPQGEFKTQKNSLPPPNFVWFLFLSSNSLRNLWGEKGELYNFHDFVDEFKVLIIAFETRLNNIQMNCKLHANNLKFYHILCRGSLPEQYDTLGEKSQRQRALKFIVFHGPVPAL